VISAAGFGAGESGGRGGLGVGEPVGDAGKPGSRVLQVLEVAVDGLFDDGVDILVGNDAVR
jgi:hypothetical protein